MLLKILPQKCMSVAKEGKVFEPKKLLQPLLETSEGTKITWISFFSQVRLRRSSLVSSQPVKSSLIPSGASRSVRVLLMVEALYQICHLSHTSIEDHVRLDSTSLN